MDAPEAEPVLRRVEAQRREASCRSSRRTTTPTTRWRTRSSRSASACPSTVTPPTANACPASRTASRRATRSRWARHVARVLHIPAHTRGHIAYVFDERAGGVLRRHALRGRLRAALRGHARDDVRRRCASSDALPDAMRVFCGHEYTESNLVFAVHVEPDNLAAQWKLDRVREIRAKAAADWHDATERDERALDARRRARDQSVPARRRRRRARPAPRAQGQLPRLGDTAGTDRAAL